MGEQLDHGAGIRPGATAPQPVAGKDGELAACLQAPFQELRSQHVHISRVGETDDAFTPGLPGGHEGGQDVEAFLRVGEGQAGMVAGGEPIHRCRGDHASSSWA
jgi:hypothetical protein